MKSVLATLGLVLSVTAADAAVTAYTWEDNGHVYSEWSGSLNLSGLQNIQTTTGYGTRSLIQASRTYFFHAYDAYYGFSGATSSVTRLGKNGTTYTGTFSGDAFGYLTDRSFLYLDQKYRSGDKLSGAASIKNTTLSQIGISTPQTVTFTWSGDSFTHYYGVNPNPSVLADTAPVPVPAGLPLAATGLGALAWMRRKR